MRQLARNTLRFGPMPGEDQPDSTPEKGVSCPVKEDTGMPFRVLFESAPGLYLVLTPDEFSIVAVSEAYLRATMTERSDIMGRKLFDVFPDDPKDTAADGVRNLRASLERVKTKRTADVMKVQRYPVRRPENEGGGLEGRVWSPYNSPVFSYNGELIFIIHGVEDVTLFVCSKPLHGRPEEGCRLFEPRAEHRRAGL